MTDKQAALGNPLAAAGAASAKQEREGRKGEAPSENQVDRRAPAAHPTAATATSSSIPKK